MNNTAAERKASTSGAQNRVGYSLELNHYFDLGPIPLKPKSKVPLVRWSDESGEPSLVEIEVLAVKDEKRGTGKSQYAY